MYKKDVLKKVAIVVAVFTVLLFTENEIRGPALAKLSITALAKENGFDEREDDSGKKNSDKEDSNKKTSWTTALLWLIFIAGAIDVIFLRKDSTLGNKVGKRVNRFSQASQNETQSSDTINNAEQNSNVVGNSDGGGNTNAEQ